MKQRIIWKLMVLGLMFPATLAWSQAPQGKATCLTDQVIAHLLESHPDGVATRSVSSAKTTHEGEPEFLYVVPVVFHLMTNGGQELGVTLAQVQSQIEVMNEDFGRYGNGFNSHLDGLDTKIKFCLASLDPDGDPTIGLDTTFYQFANNHNPFEAGLDSAMKSLAVWDVDRYMNVYIVRTIASGSNSGYAYFPGEVMGSTLDGLVLDYRHIGRIGTAVSLGRTGSHEVGHYLDLFHPWGLEDTLCGTLNGDYCDDTPEVPTQFFSIAPSCFRPPSCGDSLRQIENYMDYSDEECQNMFTFNQCQRMRLALYRYRSELISSENLALTGCSGELTSEPTKEEFIVFPNPATDIVMVYADFDDDNPVSIELYDFSGRLVVKKDPAGQGRGAIPIDVSQIATGTYHVLVRMESRYLRKTIFVGR